MPLPQRPLGDALQLASKKVPVSADEEYRIAGIYSFGRGLIKRPTITGAETSYSTLTRIEADQLAMSKLNAWEGALAVVTDEFDGAHVSPEYPVFDINRDVADPAYIKHLIAWPALWKRLTPRGSMVRRKRTTPTTLMETFVPLPDLDEQRRIAASLDKINTQLTRIRAAKQRSKKLEEILLHSLIKNSSEPRTLGNVIRHVPSEELVEKEEMYSIAGVYGFGRGLFKRGPIRGRETSYRKLNRLVHGRLVMSKLKAFEGAVAVIPPEFDGWYLSPEFPTFEIDTQKADPMFMAGICMWPEFWALLREQSKGIGARKERVSPERLLSVPVPLPELQEQQRIAKSLSRLRKTRTMTAQQKDCIDSISFALLNKAFSGNL